MWTVCKAFTGSVTTLLMFWVFGLEACETSAPHPVIESTPAAFEGQVPATRLPGKSQHVIK